MSPPVICQFFPKDGMRITEEKRGRVSLTCTNRMFNLNQAIVIISLDPTIDGETLSICEPKDYICRMDTMLYVTSTEATFNLMVTAKNYGIRCLKVMSVYHSFSMIFPSSMSMEDLQLMYNTSGQEIISLEAAIQMDIPVHCTLKFL